MNPSPTQAPVRGPNCWQCKHFAVSWDPRMPYACKRMGFKSAVLPSLQVLRADGQLCRSFEIKNLTIPAPQAPAPSQKTWA